LEKVLTLGEQSKKEGLEHLKEDHNMLPRSLNDFDEDLLPAEYKRTYSIAASTDSIIQN
jgi:hypothetical protein